MTRHRELQAWSCGSSSDSFPAQGVWDPLELRHRLLWVLPSEIHCRAVTPAVLTPASCGEEDLGIRNELHFLTLENCTKLSPRASHTRGGGVVAREPPGCACSCHFPLPALVGEGEIQHFCKAGEAVWSWEQDVCDRRDAPSPAQTPPFLAGTPGRGRLQLGAASTPESFSQERFAAHSGSSGSPCLLSGGRQRMRRELGTQGVQLFGKAVQSCPSPEQQCPAWLQPVLGLSRLSCARPRRGSLGTEVAPGWRWPGWDGAGGSGVYTCQCLSSIAWINTWLGLPFLCFFVSKWILSVPR